MGMFDNVKYENNCIKCGRLLTNWQSKSGPCILATLEPWEVKEMYTCCPSCRTWNEYDVNAIVETIVKQLDITLHKDLDEEEDSALNQC